MSLDINLTGIQSIPIVVNANITAENDSVYHVIANATFTDPTGVEGKGFKVFVRNGTAVVGGVSYSVIGSIIVRTFHSGAWSTVYYYDYLTSNNLFQSRANLSTNVNTDQASNSKYPSVKAVFDWAIGLFVPSSRTINGFDLSANRTLTTADIADSTNKRYVTDANLTVLGNTSGTNTGDQDLSGYVQDSDFSSHSVLAKQSGAGSPVAVTIGTNEILGRLSGGGSNIEGLSTSQVKTLLNYTTADIADSSNKRYVTDAQLTVLGNTSNTNTGDETQASILSKLGWFNIINQTAGTTSSGTTNTISKSIALPSVPSVLNFRANFLKTGANNTYTVRAYLSEVDNNIGGTAILIATITGANSAVTNLPMKRTFDIIGGNVIGLNSSASQATDDVNVSNARLNLAIPTGTPLYLIFAVQCTSASDSARFESCQINNFSF